MHVNVTIILMRLNGVAVDVAWPTIVGDVCVVLALNAADAIDVLSNQTADWCRDAVDGVVLYRQWERTHGGPTHQTNMNRLTMATDVHRSRQEFLV